MQTLFRAFDGREFRFSIGYDENEIKEKVEKYENDLHGRLEMEYMKVCLPTTNPQELFDEGCDDEKIDIVKPRSIEDINRVNRYLDACVDRYGYAGQSRDHLNKSHIGKCVYISWWYERDGYYIMGTREEYLAMICERMKKLESQKVGCTERRWGIFY